MKVRILGCGAAGGVPMISRGWGACDPKNPKNRRRRSSILIEIDGKRILVDTSPDLREQLLDANVNALDAVLYTHEHADHLHGIDDLREVNRVIKAPLPVFANRATLNHLKKHFPYVFGAINIGREPIFHPWLEPHLITSGEPFVAAGVQIMPFMQDHEWTTSFGYRIGSFAYSTDVVRLFDSSLSILKGVETWIVGCLSDKDHPSHASIARVEEWVDIIRPKRTILTHMAVGMDYDTLCRTLPKGIDPAFDGMEIEI